MARKNKRWVNHQSIGETTPKWGHVHQPIPTRWGYVCLACGRGVTEQGEER